MNLSPETKDIFSALALAQASIEGAVKDKVNPAFKSKYADLSSVIDAAKQPLKANGLALTIGMAPSPDGVALEALLTHSSGQWIAYAPFHVLVTKKDAQGIGSAVTYGRRYLTMAILGIPAEDDDGNAAAQHRPQETRPSEKPSTHRERTLEYLSSVKAHLSAKQVAELGKLVQSAGTTPALLDNVVTEAKKYLAENEASEAFDRTARAVADGVGGEVVA